MGDSWWVLVVPRKSFGKGLEGVDSLLPWSRGHVEAELDVDIAHY